VRTMLIISYGIAKL